MRNVPASVTAGWEAQAKTGNARPVVRAIVKKQHLRRYEYDTAWAPGGDYNDRHRAGHFASFIFGDNSGYIEIENIKSWEWDRSVGQDAATATLTLLNTEMTAIGDASHLNPTDPNEFDQPGYFTPNRGNDTISPNRWGYDTETGWNNYLVPDSCIETFEGYGCDETVSPPNDPYLVQSGKWLIDKVTYTATGEITIEMRDLARLLLENVVFPPAIPMSEYPLSWIATHTESVPARDAQGGHWQDKLNTFGSGSSSNSLYIGQGFTNAPFASYVGSGGGVDGHSDNMPIMNHDGGDIDKYWVSTGQDNASDFVWWQFQTDAGTVPVNALRFRLTGGPYRMYISIHNGTKWVGRKTIPYQVGTDTTSPSSVDIGADIPFVKSVIADRHFEFDAILPRVYEAKKIRLTFTRLLQRPVGEHMFRAGLREMKIYTASSASDLSFGSGSIEKVIGNYADYTHIIKWVCAWAGWYWPPHTTGDDFISVDADDGSGGTVKKYVTYSSMDPVLPKGRVWGDFMRTGTTGVADLTVDLFDKKPLMDIINYVRDLLGFLFFIDETGGVVWRMPNLGLGGSPKLGNYLSPDDILDTDGHRLIGNRGRGGRTSDIITLDEETNLLSYEVMLSSENIRDRIFVANAVGGVGVVIKGFNPNPVGFRRVGGWTDQHFKNKREARVMADMISAQQMFSYRVGQAVIPGYPAIQVDDQIRIYERVTNETFYHYVTGIKSSMDLENGVWTYTLDTHWLGEDPTDAWVVDVEQLDGWTKQFLLAVGYDPSGAEDNG